MQFPTIEQVVRYRLELYLDQLDGTPPNNVHAMVIQAAERAAIDFILEYAEGNQALAADYLGLSRPTLRKKLVSASQ
ncbi:helix-turn-helix domain-containing protein [Paraburkholderia kururiensis]|uniref:helix-turn-helix domain-containing protein n=1 Tax=Paraburkholderia kururiensis TaxID=984307 RepID=UPI0018F7CED1|nr:helix-turn-helix domain-containing protein [Paraburkholderia kururiensis]